MIYTYIHTYIYTHFYTLYIYILKVYASWLLARCPSTWLSAASLHASAKNLLLSEAGSTSAAQSWLSNDPVLGRVKPCQTHETWWFPEIEVPESSILTGFSLINHPFWGSPFSGTPQIWFDILSNLPAAEGHQGTQGSIYSKMEFHQHKLVFNHLTYGRKQKQCSGNNILFPTSSFFTSHMVEDKISLHEFFFWKGLSSMADFIRDIHVRVWPLSILDWA